MKKYKLKEEAKRYFSADFHKLEYELPMWKDFGVSLDAIEEVNRVFVNFGIKENDNCVAMSKWDGNKNKASFHFTVNIFGLTNKEYEALRIDRQKLEVLLAALQDASESFVECKLQL